MKAPSRSYHDDETSAADAKEALRQGREPPLAQHLGDMAEGLKILAEMFDPTDDLKPAIQIQQASASSAKTSKANRKSGPEPTEDWEGNLRQFKLAVASGNAAAIGSYVRDASDVLHRLATTLDPTAGSKGWRLTFVRRGRGKPSDPIKQLLDNSQIARELAFETKRVGKQEAAIQALADNKKGSRAKLFRAKANARPKNKSHKKR